MGLWYTYVEEIVEGKEKKRGRGKGKVRWEW